MKDDAIVACCGIVNFQFNRGEAWMIPSYLFPKFAFSVIKLFKSMLPDIARRGKFHRVQATSFDAEHDKYFELLGFKYEGTLLAYGPAGEDVRMYGMVIENV